MASMDELILLKLGGSLITEKTVAHTARTKVIGRIAEEIKKAMQIDEFLRGWHNAKFIRMT